MGSDYDSGATPHADLISVWRECVTTREAPTAAGTNLACATVLPQ